LCLAETNTYLQIIGPSETINVTIGNTTNTTNITISNVTNASRCNVSINVEDIEYDNIQEAFLYFISGEGSFYFETTFIGNSSSSGTNNNDNHGEHGRHANDASTQSRYCNHGSGRRNNITNYVISPLNFTIGNVTYCVNITMSEISGNTAHNDRDGNSGGSFHHGEHGDHGNNEDHHPSPNPHHTPNPAPSTVIAINITIANNTNNTIIVTNTTRNNTAGNITSNVTVKVVPAGTNAIGNDPNNQFTYTDQSGSNPRYAQIRDNLLNNRMQIENQLDNEIQNQGFGVESETDVDITARNNVIKLTSLFLFPQGTSEDAKQDTCNALANTAESFSNITFTTDCDFTAIPKLPNGQAGDYVLISTYSTNGDSNVGMALIWSMFAILIAFLSCNF